MSCWLVSMMGRVFCDWMYRNEFFFESIPKFKGVELCPRKFLYSLDVNEYLRESLASLYTPTYMLACQD